MKPVVSIGTQSFEKLRQNKSFYVDKTGLIEEWWGNQDDVTLITRPRRFGKTLNLDMLNCFFLTGMRKEAIFLRGFPSGKRKSSGNCRGRIRSYF